MAEQDQLIRETHQRVCEIHTMLNMRGGIIDRVEHLEKQSEWTQALRARIGLIASLVSIGASLLTLWIRERFFR